MRKLKHIDYLVSDLKKYKQRKYIVLVDNIIFKFRENTESDIEFLRSYNINNFNATFKYISEFRICKKDYKLIKLDINFINFKKSGIKIGKYKIN